MSVNLLARHTAVTTPCRPFSPWVTTLCSSTPARSGDLTVFSKKHYSSKSWGFFVPQPELTQSGSSASRCFSPCKRIWRSERTGHIHRRGSAGRVLSSRNLRHVEVSHGWTNRGDYRAMASIQRDTVGPGQESVWDYPRPPRLEPVQDKIKIVFNGETIAETTGAYRVLETSHPPVYYIPTADFKMEHVTRAAGRSFCEWKGDATWWSISVGAKTAEKAAWSYENPTSSFLPIKGFLAVYAGPMDACFVGEEKAQPQPGNFYGGWVTSKVVGPFKGGLGSYGW